MKVPVSRWSVVLAAMLTLLVWTSRAHAAFDQDHTLWSGLLARHVKWVDGSSASRVDYAGLQAERPDLERYLNQLSAVSEAEYAGWSGPQQLAFLINAYNAFTVDLVLTRYPRLSSIKDVGTWLQSPWKKRFFTLFRRPFSLDDIEGTIRVPGVFDEPRIHVALVCASIGCPALRPEAYTAKHLEAQLNDSLQRFLSDRNRNRYKPATGELEVSRIFDWYREDWEHGPHGFGTLESLFAGYADQLASEQASRAAIRARKASVAFLPYDWRLNALR